jgi:hypothetical protein
MSATRTLTVADALRALQDDIQAEHTLIASRVTWYVTSQAFLLTAFAMSWNAGFTWPEFFRHAVPVTAIVLSAVLFASIYAATWAQDVYLREQAWLVSRVKTDLALDPSEQLALDVYERTMVANRTSADGRAIGGRIHALGRIAPLALPIGFAALWLFAYFCAPGLAT